MAYAVRIPKRVVKQLDGLATPHFDRVQRTLEDLKTNPRPHGVRKLKGVANTYRVRVGEYRVLYEVDDAAQEIRLKAIGDRKDVYR